MPTILWIDDEIDLLKPHVLFLRSKGYNVETATNGADGVEHVRQHRPDLVLLDEQMPGMGGLDALGEVKKIAPEVPVVMVTKSEEEHLMEEAMGGQIADYLTKPVNPSQVLLTAKRLLDRARIEGEASQRAYLQAFPELSGRLSGAETPGDWVDLYLDLMAHDARLDAEEGVRQVLDDQLREANQAFGRYVERHYADWVAAPGPDDDRPLLSHEVFGECVVPHLREGKRPVVFLVVDCMRYDQWLEMERVLHGLFDVEKRFYFGILPTATPYARNALFSGLLPRDLHRRYPKLWTDDDDEHSKNRHEETFLLDRLDAEEGVRQVLDDQLREANQAFGRYVERHYADWVAAPGPDDDRPLLSHEVFGECVVPHLREGKRPVVFLVVDCMRYDQWLEMERVLHGLFDVEKRFYFGILPTATPYARNALFSGLLPRDLHRRYPKLWTDDDDEHSKNRHEETFLLDLLDRKHLKDLRARYIKVVSSKDGREFAQTDLTSHDLTAAVVNFVDILAHTRSDSPVLREIAPDERAYRALTRTWFEHSWLLQAFQTLSKTDATIVVTTDHGAIRCLHATKVIGDRDTSTALRYKHGRQLRVDEKHAVFVKDPETFGLPRLGLNENYLLAKEDYYFVYPTNYHHYLNLYRDSMQHGGVSLEEMVLPIITLRGKKG